jgi:diguanylate cyclase (GGDEF)-like protein
LPLGLDDDYVAKILGTAPPAPRRTPAVSGIPGPDPSNYFDDEYDRILSAGQRPTFGERASDIGSSVLHGLGAVVGAPKRAEDALIRASSKYLYGLDLGDEATSGQLVRGGLGLDPNANPESDTYGGRIAGKVTEFGTDVLTDPLTPILAGTGSAVQGGSLAARTLARAGLDIAPEVATALESAARTGARLAPVQKASQVAFGTLMGTGTLEEAARAYTKAKEQGASPEVAEALLGTLMSGYMATHVGREALHSTVDPFAEFNHAEARPEAQRVAPERPAAHAPEPVVDVAAEREFLKPDRLAEYNAMLARQTREEQQPLADAIKSMTDYETPAPRLGPKIPGEGQDFTLSPAAAEVARGGEVLPAAPTELNTTFLTPTTEITASAPDFKAFAEEKGFALTPENRAEVARQYVEEHPDATVDQRSAARAEVGVPSQPAQAENAALPLVDGDRATTALDRTEAQPTVMSDPTTMRAPEEQPALIPADAQLGRPPADTGPTAPNAITAPASLAPEEVARAEANPAETFDRKAPEQHPEVRAADDALQALVPALRDTTKIQETGLNYATPRGAQMRDASEVVGRQAAKRTASAIVDENFPSLRGEKPERIANAIERDGADPVYRAALQDMHEQVAAHAADAVPFDVPETRVTPDRRQASVDVRHERRLAQRRDAVAAEMGRPVDDPIVQRVAQAEHVANVDDLTGLNNGRAWKAIEASVRPGRDHVLYMDGKGMKAVNDTYGHAVGDQIIQHVADAVAKFAGEVDSARPHGDEFAAVLRDMTLEQAHEVGRQIQEHLDANPARVRLSDGTLVDVPGVTVHIGSGINEAAADAALNAAAAEGRKGGRGARENARRPKPGAHGTPGETGVNVPGVPEAKLREKGVGGHSFAREGTGDASAGKLGAAARVAATEPDLVGALRDSVKAKGGEPVFATGERGAAPTVDLARVQRAFKGANWQERDGAFHATINGLDVRVEPDATIHVRDVERGAAKASAEAAGGTGEQVGATYAPLDGQMLVKIAKGAGDHVIDHEALHVAMRLALSEGERRAVLRKYGWDGKGDTLPAEERAAEAYSRWTPNAPNGLFSRIAGFFRKLYRQFFPDAESVFAKVRGGDAFSRTPKPVDAAARQAQTPTVGQQEAGNYRKGHTNIGGLDISIENEAGTKRKPTFPPLADHYGYLKGTIGKDKDHVDVFVRPGTPQDYSGPVHVVDQIKKDGSFDEHKVVIGYPDADAAREAYSANYSPGFKVGPLTTFPDVESFKQWLGDADMRKPAFATKPAQADLFAKKDMLQPTEARTTEGREAEGPLFTQEADARARAEKAAQKTMFATKPKPSAPKPVELEKVGDERTVKEELARVAKSLPDTAADKAKLASDAGLTPQQLSALQARHGDATAQYVEAGRQMRDAAAKDVKAKAEAIKAGDLQSEHDFATAVTRAGAITAETTASADAANALAAHRLMAEGLRPSEVLFQKILRAHPALDPKNRTALLKAIDSGDQRAIIAATQRATKPTRMAKFLEAWKAGLVSGPPTLAGNAIGNTVFEGMRTTERGVTGLIDSVVSKIRGTEQERFASEALSAFNGIRNAFPQSLKLLANGLLTEQIDRAGGKYDTQPGAIGGTLGKVVRSPFRVLQAFDDSAKHVAAQGELFAVAWRMAMREARKGTKHEGGIQGRATEIINKTGKYVEAKIQRDAGLSLDEAATKALQDRESGMLYAAMDKAAHEATFQDAVGKFTQLAMDARSGANFMGIPLGEIVAPFIKTPSRILVQAAKRTPLGFADAARAWRGIKEGTHTQGEFSEAMAKPLMGTMMAMSFYAAARAGNITGSGPNDDTKRKLLESTGWQPYSVKVGDSYYQFKRLEPIATILGLAADLAEAKDEKTAGTIAEKLQGALIQNITEKSWLTGITNLAQAWQDPKRYGAQWVRSLEGSLVPNVVRKAAAALDPKVRDTRSALGPIIAGIPGLSQTLPARQGVTGGEQQRPATGVERFISPFPRTEARADAHLEHALLDVDYAPAPPTKTLSIPGSKAKIELSDKELAMLLEADKKTEDRLRKVVTSAGWRQLGTEEKKAYVQRAYADNRKAARYRLYAVPSVQKRANEAIKQARAEARA